jgi:hypothetical protein
MNDIGVIYAYIMQMWIHHNHHHHHHYHFRQHHHEPCRIRLKWLFPNSLGWTCLWMFIPYVQDFFASVVCIPVPTPCIVFVFMLRMHCSQSFRLPSVWILKFGTFNFRLAFVFAWWSSLIMPCKYSTNLICDSFCLSVSLSLNTKTSLQYFRITRDVTLGLRAITVSYKSFFPEISHNNLFFSSISSLKFCFHVSFFLSLCGSTSLWTLATFSVS